MYIIGTLLIGDLELNYLTMRDIAVKEWEKYWEFNEDTLSNSEDFEVAYGFVNWLKNKKLI